jgi:hypothetical protein
MYAQEQPMKRASVLAILFGFAFVPVVAQTNSAPPGSLSTQPTNSAFTAVPVAACPVNMHALQGSGTGLVAVRNAKRQSGFSQSIHLVLANPRSKQIAWAKLKVYGLSGKNRDLTLNLTSSPGSSDVTRTLDVPFTPEGERDVAADLVLQGFTSVTSIHLLDVTYTDGSIWAVSTARECRVSPDPLMLVAGR